MALKGVLGNIAWIDLIRGQVTIEQPEENIYTTYLGGYGLGAYYLYTRQPAGIDALDAQSTLGITTGPLTGTDAITGNRFAAVGKSPKTGGWGDANCGGVFGPSLKQAGLDAVFITGISAEPVYVLVEDGQASLQDASSLWGLGCLETEAKLKQLHGENARAAVIGPAGERVSALAAIINDGGRAAGRSGLGMVMGSKRVKAVVAVGGGSVAVAEESALKDLRKKLISEHYRKGKPVYDFFHNVGTPGVLEPAFLKGDAPTKNWEGWTDHFPTYEAINGQSVIALQTKRYGCWKCPISCGGHVDVASGPYAGSGHKPEYETLGAFGTMCLNDNVESICRLNNICNDFGMDTISTGCTVAFAIECFENGIIGTKDTQGIELTWGNHEAIVEITEQMAKGEGFGGQILSDGIAEAVQRLGKDSRAFAMECGGEELPMHDPRCYPGLGASYVVDATPGRHTQNGSWNVEGGGGPPGLNCPRIEDRYTYSGKGEAHRKASSFGHVVNAAGLCNFSTMLTPATAVPDYLSMAMGVDFSLEDILLIGERIANLRIAFNLREGIRNKEHYVLPGRVLGKPALTGGPTGGVSVDNDTQIKDYYNAMGWNPETGVPARSVLERLGLHFALEVSEG